MQLCKETKRNRFQHIVGKKARKVNNLSSRRDRRNKSEIV